ncbi:MAG: hypothetical protein Q9181_002280 [Wetmoreana brouardii]
MAQTQSSIKEVIPDIGGNFSLDENVIAAEQLTGRFDLVIQCATEGGRIMMEGEFNSMSELYKLAPTFVPQPHAWGKFQLADPVTHFFLCDFLDMEKQMPEPTSFCARLAEIHQNSVSPTGKFGFIVPNCHGKILQSNDWNSDWASFFTKLLLSFLRLELDINGPWKEYEQAFETIVATVIPQLLGPLQTDGRILKPCLVHGDLWEENAAIDLSTGDPVVFDASAFYAHNEYELGTWRRQEVKFGRTYFIQYFRNMPPSEPAEQWDDRIRLYSLKFNLAHMIGWPGAPFVREEYVSFSVLLSSRLMNAESITT